MDAEDPVGDARFSINWGAVFWPWLWSLAHGVWPWFWAFTLVQVALFPVGFALNLYLSAHIWVLAVVWFGISLVQWLLSVQLGRNADELVALRDAQRRDIGQPLSLTRSELPESYARNRILWARWGVVVTALLWGWNIFNTATTQPYRLPLSLAGILAAAPALAWAWFLTRRGRAAARGSGRARTAPSPVVWIAVAGVGLAAVVVLFVRGPSVPVTDPGSGTTIADQVYTTLQPKVGERATSPNPSYGEPTLSKRFLRLVDSNPTWSVVIVYDPRNQTGTTFYDRSRFQDGSSIVFVEKPMPGPHNPPPGEDSGSQLERVELYR